MAKKLPMLEEFEQSKSACKCGGNCQCNKSVNEAKKYNFKDIAKAWEFTYGEDMEDEYQGFYQEVTGKYKNKVTKQDIADIWQKVYGEDIAAEYGGFFDSIKESLAAANQLEEFNALNEAKPDGTISDDEDERREDLLAKTEAAIDELLANMKEEAYEIGGQFRGPGIFADNKKLIETKIRKFR